MFHLKRDELKDDGAKVFRRKFRPAGDGRVRIRQRRQRRFADDEALAGTDLSGVV
jgi:hypothetical protein